jgi:hypothetical protein
MPTEKKKPTKRKRIAKVFLGILLLLIVIRLALPYVIKWYLNNQVLNQMENYRGHIKDVDLALWRGAYIIDDLDIVKIGTEIEEPFVYIKTVDLSVQWNALFKGAIVGEVEADEPVINFAFSKEEEKSQTGMEEDWVSIVTDLIPIRINRFTVKNGTIKLINLFSELEKGDLSLDAINLEVLNIQNVTDNSVALPTSIKMDADAPGYGGQLNVTANAMLLKQIPDFDYNLQFENATLIEFNPLIENYTGMNVEAGKLSLYSEMVLNDGNFEGYFKPLLEDLRIFDWKEENRNFGQWIKEFFSEGIKEVFENQKKEQFATRIPIKGSLDNLKANIWLTIINAFKNAYISAFQHQLDQTINFKEIKLANEAKKAKKGIFQKGIFSKKEAEEKGSKDKK